MKKVINAHCHIYPEKIAARAIEGIKSFYGIDMMTLNGMTDDMVKDGSRVGCVHYLVHSVATVPAQVRSINEFIASEVRGSRGMFTGFGTLHPDSEDIAGDAEHLVSLGLKGIKLHPDFQQFSLDGEKAVAIGEAVKDLHIPLLIHCGDRRGSCSNPAQMSVFLRRFPELTVIGAHMGGWEMWEEAREVLPGFDNLLVDCSSTLYALSAEEGTRLIRAFGAQRVLWGTDYPMWDAATEMEYFDRLDLTERERGLILYENAASLLGLE